MLLFNFSIYIQLGEFKKGLNEDLDYSSMKLLSDHEVFVAYAWYWKQNEDEYPEDESCSTTPSLSPVSESELDFNTGFTSHTVTFKCMGTTKDNDHQETLRATSGLLREGSDVPVRLRPEPDNPVDANAIAFECQIGSDWKRIGYVVRDILMEVHEAITKQNIISVKIAWIKYLLCWKNSGPGFYAGINVSICGSWSPKCIRVASTK